MSGVTAYGTPKLKDKDLAANFGWSLAVLNSNPELKDIFKKAVKKQYTKERFTAEVMGTKWFQTQSENSRKYTILKETDPAQYVSLIKQTMASFADEYSQLTGEVLDYQAPSLNASKKKDKNGVFAKIKDGDGTLFRIADTALKMGWNEAQIKNHIAAAVDWRNLVARDKLGGTSSGQLQSWRQAAAALGVKPTDNWFADRLKSTALGDNTNEGVIGMLKNQAKQRYKAFADDIENGATMQDLTENYRQSIGNVLEISPNQVDVFDKNIQKAVNNRDADGNYTPMSIGDFEKVLRQDDRWQYTKNAKDTITSSTQGVLRSLGLVA